MNPVLRKLSKVGLSRIEAANLLEKHIGSGANELHCKSAIAALERLRDAEQNSVARVLARLIIAANENPCVAVREVIEYLRQPAPYLDSEGT